MSLVQSIEARLPSEAVRRRGPLRPAALSPSRRRIEATAIARLFGGFDTTLLAAGALAVLTLTAGAPLELTLARAAPILAGAVTARSLLRAAECYAFTPRLSHSRHLAKVAAVGLAGSVAAVMVARLLGQDPAQALAGGAVLGLALLATHLLWLAQVGQWRRAGRLIPNVVVVGATENAKRLIEAAIASRDVAILGVFDDRAARSPDAVAGVPVLGDTGALLTHPLLPFVDRIVITVPPSAQARVRMLIDRLRVLPNAVTLYLEVEGANAQAATVDRLARAASTQVSGSERNEKRAFEKRVQDLVLASVGLVLTAPVMAVVAILVKLDSPGPALFRQRRHGFNNEVITVWKFRSMRTDAADATASRQVTVDDDRVTRVGRIIRKLSLDELPQLVNVLRGEMSLVGPRPHAIGMRTAGEESAKLVAEYAWRHRMKPGITGWAQINGSIGAVDTPEAVRRRVALDVEYIETQSLWLDLYIVLMTIPALVGSRRAVR
jgi:Undecaprenyl-phosphate glucose phosphotransferase